MKYLYIYFCIISYLFSCKVAEDLTFQKIKYGTDELRINGYFYSESKNNSESVFFLYENGIFLDWGGVSNSLRLNLFSINEIRDSTIHHFSNLGYHKNLQYGWGVWKIENNQIVVESWLTGVGGAYPVGRYVGDIINDSIIMIAFTYQLPPVGTEKKERFMFREFNPKPDSTNQFIK